MAYQPSCSIYRMNTEILTLSLLDFPAVGLHKMQFHLQRLNNNQMWWKFIFIQPKNKQNISGRFC